MDGITVREATAQDCEAIYHLNCDAMGYDYPLEETRERLDFLLNHRGHKILVAVGEKEIIGYIHGNDYDLLYSKPLKNIMGIAVSKRFRKRGIGSLLLQELEQWAKDSGAAGIRLVSGEQRVGAHSFYRACGYTERKLQKNFLKLF